MVTRLTALSLHTHTHTSPPSSFFFTSAPRLTLREIARISLGCRSFCCFSLLTSLYFLSSILALVSYFFVSPLFTSSTFVARFVGVNSAIIRVIGIIRLKGLVLITAGIYVFSCAARLSRRNTDCFSLLN